MNTTKVKLDLTKINGNAYALLAVFSNAAKAQGWTTDEVNAIVVKATSGDYDNLVRVLSNQCVC